LAKIKKRSIYDRPTTEEKQEHQKMPVMKDLSLASIKAQIDYGRESQNNIWMWLGRLGARLRGHK